ncbi:MAG TPA: M1 family aminopeptidase, partial [Candidatus Polarisedimenticolaceae bacterium]|nr:M1 family aminopeptidase [Candidatus Polarisedimenticolaceae bacterium]
HQWWGSMVTNANGRNYWFVESLAEYSSALFVEAINSDPKKPEKGRKAYLEKVADWRRNILESGMIGSVQNATSLWSNGARNAAIYNQGPYAFHILRETFGDAKFFPFMKKLAQELKGKEIVTRDIQRISEESFGINMDWFWDQWIRGVGLPQFTFNYTTRKTEDGAYLVEGKIRQRVVAGPDKTPIPGVFYNALAKVVAIGSKGEYPKQVAIQGEETSFKFKVAEEPIDVVFNKSGEVLATDVLVNRGF